MKSKKTMIKSSSKISMSRDMTNGSNTKLPPVLASMPESQENSCRSQTINLQFDAGNKEAKDAHHAHASSKFSLPPLTMPVMETGKTQRQFNR
jgi:hypothetical protein